MVSKSVTIEYTGVVYVIAAALFVAAIAAIAHLLINDKIVSEQEKKPTIIKRVVQFFRDYKSEVKKIVWPSLNDVVKNTLIVLIICVIIGIFIWALDFGLAELLDLILGNKA
ncbi:MAG: preprotein translocase subunit SecE [Ruminococcaceae bacterium]|nr:preprotein translocase subunit SecE [Oscillospiraceae bacterium]